MSRYPAFLDGEARAYGVTFPDVQGIVAQTYTPRGRQAVRHALTRQRESV